MENLDTINGIIAEELNRRPVEVDKLDRFWEAAVMLPLVQTDKGVEILFEVRAGNLKRQPGQICFPGGKYEASDGCLASTAIRETMEELGLAREDVKLIGELDTFVTFDGPVIHPFVGNILKPEKISYNPQEVQEAFTVPLKFFLDNEPDCYKMDMADKPQEDFPFYLVPAKNKSWRFLKQYNVYFYTYEKHVIWGMTARMLYGFLVRYKDLLKKIM